jgi:hypothetical protein
MPSAREFIPRKILLFLRIPSAVCESDFSPLVSSVFIS